MFANSSMMGINLGFPDVCQTPDGPAPVPVPYPNIAMSPMAIPSQLTVFIEAMLVHNLGTEIPMTNGDNAGLELGVASGTVMEPPGHLLDANKVLVGGMPVTRLTSMSLQNSTSAPGLRLVPNQLKMPVLAP